MKRSSKVLLISGAAIAALAGAATFRHSPALHRHFAALHGGGGLHGHAGIHASGPAADMVGESGGDPLLNARARVGVATIGTRWDAAAFAETVAQAAKVGILAATLLPAVTAWPLFRLARQPAEVGPVSEV